MRDLQTRKMYHISDKPIDRDLYQAVADEDQRPVTLLDYGSHRVLARFRPSYRTLDDIVRRNRAAGGKWFDPSNMRFFGTRLQSRIYPAKDGRAYFVTSERDRYPEGGAWGGRRLYSVRVALPNGDIETAGEFGEYATGRAAHAAARKLAGRENEWLHMPEDFTCGCGLYVHPRRSNPAAIHIEDCAYAPSGERRKGAPQ